MPKPTVIAHRGFSAVAPENTLPAFDRAIDAGADMIELDVRLTADHKLAVMHDATLERTTNGHGAVIHQPLDALRRLDAGRWFDPKFAGTAVPTLDETIDVCRHRVMLNVEVKTEERDDEALERLAERVAERIVAQDAIRWVVVSSYTRQVVNHLRRVDRRLATALLTDRLFTDRCTTKLAAESGAIALHVPHRLASSELVRGARERGLLSAIHTVNQVADMRRVLDLGFDAIFTDHPDRLRQVIDTRESADVETPTLEEGVA